MVLYPKHKISISEIYQTLKAHKPSKGILLNLLLTSCYPFSLNYLLKGPISRFIHMGARASTYAFEGTQFIP